MSGCTRERHWQPDRSDRGSTASASPASASRCSASPAGCSIQPSKHPHFRRNVRHGHSLRRLIFEMGSSRLLPRSLVEQTVGNKVLFEAGGRQRRRRKGAGQKSARIVEVNFSQHGSRQTNRANRPVALDWSHVCPVLVPGFEPAPFLLIKQLCVGVTRWRLVATRSED